MEHLVNVNEQRRQIEEGRRQVEVASEVRKRVQELACHVLPTDGGDREQLRHWLLQVDEISRWTRAPDPVIIDVAGQLSRTPLSSAILTIRDGLVDADGERTWPNVRVAIQAQFLETDELQYLQARLDRLVQQPFEDMRGYARRFRTQMALAYPVDEREVESVRNRLIRLFVSGIQSEGVRQQVAKDRAQTLDAAITLANDVEDSFRTARVEVRGENRLGGTQHQNMRVEEPMDISAMALNLDNTLKTAMKEVHHEVKTMQGELKSLRKVVGTPQATGGTEAVVAAVQTTQPDVQVQNDGQKQQGQGQHWQQTPMWGNSFHPQMQMPWMQPYSYYPQMQQAPFMPQTCGQAAPGWAPQCSHMQQGGPPACTHAPQPQPPVGGPLPNTGGYGGRPYGGGQEGGRPWRPRACYECGELDHIARNCPKKGVALQAAVDAALELRQSKQPAQKQQSQTRGN